MSIHTVGIDPGFEGGIALVGPVLRVWDMPVYTRHLKTKTKSGNAKKRTEYDLPQMRELLLEISGLCGEHEPVFVFETVNPMPGQNVTATWAQSRGIALWEGLLVGMGFPYRTVRPQEWKKVIWKGFGSDKAAGYQVACQLYPSIAGQLRTPRGKLIDGRTDALCIATWGAGTQNDG